MSLITGDNCFRPSKKGQQLPSAALTTTKCSSLSQLTPQEFGKAAPTLVHPMLLCHLHTNTLPPLPHTHTLPAWPGLAPGEFVFLLNNGPEPATAIYNGANNGLGLNEATAQIMRFDVQPLPVGQVARPFTTAQQAALDAALTANYAATVVPFVPPATARQVCRQGVELFGNGS